MLNLGPPWPVKLAQKISHHSGWPVHWRMSTSILGLYPLHATTTCPAVTKSPSEPWEENSPSVESHCLREFFLLDMVLGDVITGAGLKGQGEKGHCLGHKISRDSCTILRMSASLNLHPKTLTYLSFLLMYGISIILTRINLILLITGSSSRVLWRILLCILCRVVYEKPQEDFCLFFGNRDVFPKPLDCFYLMNIMNCTIIWFLFHCLLLIPPPFFFVLSIVKLGNQTSSFRGMNV